MVGSSSAQKTSQTALVYGTLNGAIAKQMVIGPFIVAFAVQVQGFSNAQLSWFLTVLPLLVLLRYPFLDVLRPFPRIKVLHVARAVQISCLAALLILPTDWITLPVLVLIAAWFVFGNEFLQNAVWMNLVAEVSAPSDRGRFLGRLRTWKQTTAMCFALFGFFVVGSELSRAEFSILLVVAGLLLINSLYWYAKVPATPPASDARAFSGRGQAWSILRTNPMLRRPLALSFVNAVLHWPILIVFIVGSLHLPANLLMLTVVAAMTGSIVSEVSWGAKADRSGIKHVFLIYYLGSFALYPLLFFVPDYAAIETGSVQWIIGTIMLLSFYFFSGVLDAGQMMAASMYRAHYLNTPSGFHAVNLLTALTQLFTGLLTALGGVILVTLAVPEPSQSGAIWIDPFRVTTITIMLATVAIGVWISTGIALENRTNPAAGDSISA